MPSWKAVPKAIRARFPAPPRRDGYESQDEFEEALGYWRSQIGRSVAYALHEHRETPRKLFYRVVPHNGGLVFAEPERAEYIAQIHAAIKSSKTWGAFLGNVPADEAHDVLRTICDALGEQRPGDNGPFSGEAVPGWSDGEYPPWLQQELDGVLPRDVLSAFAKRTATAVNGYYWHIPQERLSEVVTALQNLGFTLVHRPCLEFH